MSWTTGKQTAPQHAQLQHVANANEQAQAAPSASRSSSAAKGQKRRAALSTGLAACFPFVDGTADDAQVREIDEYTSEPFEPRLGETQLSW
jgi:hypothetical protein